MVFDSFTGKLLSMFGTTWVYEFIFSIKNYIISKCRSDVSDEFSIQIEICSKCEIHLMGCPGGSFLKRLALHLGSGHDLTVCGIKPHVRLCTDSMEPAWDSVSPSLSAPPQLMHTPVCAHACVHSLSKQINKLKKKEIHIECQRLSMSKRMSSISIVFVC